MAATGLIDVSNLTRWDFICENNKQGYNNGLFLQQTVHIQMWLQHQFTWHFNSVNNNITLMFQHLVHICYSGNNINYQRNNAC